MAYTGTKNKKESAIGLARLSLYKEAALNKEPSIIFARYQQPVWSTSNYSFESGSNMAIRFHKAEVYLGI
jgi:hypothetical protein